MITSRVRVFPVVFALLFLTAYAPEASTAQTCQRVAVTQAAIAQFESAPASNTAQRLETDHGFALELNSIRTDTADPDLASASVALANLYWTTAHLAETNPLMTSTELRHENGDFLDSERINEVNETYLRACDIGYRLQLIFAKSGDNSRKVGNCIHVKPTFIFT